MVDSKQIGKYIVYSDGRIWSTNKNKFLTICKTKIGYSVVVMNGKRNYLHRILAEAFILNINNLPQVNHINSMKDDNRLDNLEWVSASENIKHSYISGRIAANIKLTNDDIFDIRNSTSKSVELANKYGVSQTLISLIKNNKRRLL